MSLCVCQLSILRKHYRVVVHPNIITSVVEIDPAAAPCRPGVKQNLHIDVRHFRQKFERHRARALGDDEGQIDDFLLEEALT